MASFELAHARDSERTGALQDTLRSRWDLSWGGGGSEVACPINASVGYGPQLLVSASKNEAHREPIDRRPRSRHQRTFDPARETLTAPPSPGALSTPRPEAFTSM